MSDNLHTNTGGIGVVLMSISWFFSFLTIHATNLPVILSSLASFMAGAYYAIGIYIRWKNKDDK